MSYKISRQEWDKFHEHYTWQLLATPDYRLGQAFLNYFGEQDLIMKSHGDLGMRDSVALYYETDNDRAQELINKWLDQ
jgi:hypothetical protein